MSSNYGNSERVIAKYLHAFPGIKIRIEKHYQSLDAVRYRKQYDFISDSAVKDLPIQGETFFGYYDHSPESEDILLILFHL